ncbi:MAG: cupin domain-containing protein [Phycisphaerales bacterium]
MDFFTRDHAMPLSQSDHRNRAQVSENLEVPLETILDLAKQAHTVLTNHEAMATDHAAILSRIRGTGPGVSFGRLVSALELLNPIRLDRPFEGTDSIAGGVWDPAEILGLDTNSAVVKLQFDKGTDRLPLHVHEHTDRVIFVVEGRGFFHVSRQCLDSFDGTEVRSVPIRSRDVLAFTRGVVHTFSCPDEPLVLLSCHFPFVPLDAPDQYTIPRHRICPADLVHGESRIACDPSWNSLLARE